MERSAMDAITTRLSSISDLYFPTNTITQPQNPSHRKSALLNLISHDPPIFLQRYGQHLTPNELTAFEPLTVDYEVRWNVNRLRRTSGPTIATVRNRRRAYMERLILGGDYFSEDSMREREPYLHHEYLGRFRGPVGRVLYRPGEKWSETLMRRCEEGMLVERIRREQKRLGVARKDWVGGEGDEEESEEEVEVRWICCLVA